MLLTRLQFVIAELKKPYLRRRVAGLDVHTKKRIREVEELRERTLAAQHAKRLNAALAVAEPSNPAAFDQQEVRDKLS